MYPFKIDIYESESWSPFLSRRKVGGKGLNLYRLKRAGFRVPRWLVVSSSVFDEVSLRFQQEIRNLLDGADFCDNRNIEHVASRIKVLFTEAVFPARVEKRLQESFGADFNNSHTLAMRSSVADEDSATDSFAGQMESFLNVPLERAIDCIKKVWASAYSARSQIGRASCRERV